ncbi:MAG: glycosidase [Opitutus sp.]|nr:glycosidase [Opitutus sp.]MCS6247177.1 glycosidase [Opitutus sp.]MCS6274080.1 glycosidase [Opitutus sp.]MCS6276356.1 glycosidase [Opitutus sp.]MCS6301996.1 glycosidase [Opitutus sp.]
MNHLYTLQQLVDRHHNHLSRVNPPDLETDNGVLQRRQHPVITREHIPLSWRYDLNESTNPLLVEQLGVNATFNAGAIEYEGKIVLVVRIEGADRKSFFALAESDTGIDGFRFRARPLQIPDGDPAETNLYDMRLTRHADGWIYGLFCTERQDPDTKSDSISAATANCGIVRTRDLETWERLPDLKSPSKQQRNVVLHPEFVNGKYFLYTRPMEFFMHAGAEGRLCWALADSMSPCVIGEQPTLDKQTYHTIKEGKVGAGAAPIKTSEGWLHIAHAVRGCAAGMRYVLYAFLTDLEDPTRIIAAPGGYFLAPFGAERVGDVSNVLFSNGLIARNDGSVLLYYASSDTRLHVGTTSIKQLLAYVHGTPADGLRTHESVRQRLELIDRNQTLRGLNPVLDAALGA